MFVLDILTKYSCTYCLDEISGVLIKCVECNDFLLCLQCFAAGAEIGPHKNDHSYQFIISDAQDLIKSKGGWSAREELLLLNGIEGFGFGNWKDIALKLENRTAEECKEEYLKTFLHGTIGQLTWPSEVERRPQKVHDSSLMSLAKPVSPRMAPVVINQEQSEILGYMPNRDDFEKEFNNNAESIISHLNISSTEDDELDIALKLAQVDMYVDQLRERKRRKRVARDYQLISKFFNSIYLRSKSANVDQAELEEKLRFLCQFLTSQEFDSFVNSWLRQISLRRRASELARYRQAGLTRYEEIPHYEQESIYRSDTKPSLLLAPNTSPGRFWSVAPALERVTESSQVAPLCSGSSDLRSPQPLSQDYSLPPRLSPHHLPPHLQLQQVQPKKSERSEETGYCSTERSCTSLTDIQRSSLPTEQEQQPWLQPSKPSKSTDQPHHLLSNSESHLCSCLDLTPTQYISIKTHLLTKPSDLSENSGEKPIYDYINANNWFIS